MSENCLDIINQELQHLGRGTAGCCSAGTLRLKQSNVYLLLVVTAAGLESGLSLESNLETISNLSQCLGCFDFDWFGLSQQSHL